MNKCLVYIFLIILISTLFTFLFYQLEGFQQQYKLFNMYIWPRGIKIFNAFNHTGGDQHSQSKKQKSRKTGLKWPKRIEITSTINGSDNVNGSKKNKPRKVLLLMVGILSKLSAADRRNSIRLTWMKTCKENHEQVQCNFFTDSLHEQTNNSIAKYREEENSNKDLIFMPYKGGLNFGLRLYWMLKWSFSKYDYKYFLRIDDDYFLCLERLLKELPQRPQNGLYWGHLHCVNHMVRIDEGWLMLSRDFINESLDKYNTSLKCHPFGGQTVAIWENESKINVVYFHDVRVVHEATAFQTDKYLKRGICKKNIGLHGSYSQLMLKYWNLELENNVTDTANYHYEIPPIKPYDTYCKYPKKLDWNYFESVYKHKPKPCKDNPSWSANTLEYKGREELLGKQLRSRKNESLFN